MPYLHPISGVIKFVRDAQQANQEAMRKGEVLLSAMLNQLVNSSTLMATAAVPALRTPAAAGPLTRLPLPPLVVPDTADYNHPAVQLAYFECVVRFSRYFEAVPEAIQRPLGVFLSERYGPVDERYFSRVCRRILRPANGHLASALPTPQGPVPRKRGDAIGGHAPVCTLCARPSAASRAARPSHPDKSAGMALPMQPKGRAPSLTLSVSVVCAGPGTAFQRLLVDASVVQARPKAPVRVRAPGAAPLSAAAQSDPAADQMFLYEAAGLLVAMDAISNADRAEYLKVWRALSNAAAKVGHPQTLYACSHRACAYLQMLIQPLLAQVEETLSRRLYESDTPENPVFVDLLHHHFMAIGSVAKGAHKQPLRVDSSRPWALT